MNRGKKILVIVLTVCMIGLLFCGCSEKEKSVQNSISVAPSLEEMPVLVGNIPCKFPLVTEDTSMNILFTGYQGVNTEDIYVWQKYEEITGVKINWTTIQKGMQSEAVYSTLTNNNPVDLMLRCKIPATTLSQYGGSGLLIDLAKDDLLKKNAPNCWAYLESHPDALASVMNPDGTMYALPQINSGAELRVARKLFINKKWLHNVNMELPATTDEFYQVLKAFKEQDANGNGNPNDEIPLCSTDWISVRDALYGSFGLANRGIHNLIVDCDEATGKARFVPTSDAYKAFLEYSHTLYDEGLLDNYIFSIKKEQWQSNANNDLIGVFSSTNLAWMPSEQLDNWIAIEEPLEGPNGDKLWAPIRANFHSTGAAAIPATCRNPELVLRWLDYFWTDEGTLFYHMGIEGETFVATKDGGFDYDQFIYDNIKTSNSSFDDIVAQYSPYPGGSNPTVEIAPYFKGGEMAPIPAAAARKLFEYGPNEYWPSFTFTPEENERLTTLEADITKYYTSSEMDFIIGAVPLSNWNVYLAQVNHLGKDELLDIYQAAIDRYHNM